jgi:hypothetical protein
MSSPGPHHDFGITSRHRSSPSRLSSVVAEKALQVELEAHLLGDEKSVLEAFDGDSDSALHSTAQGLDALLKMR